MPTLEELLGIGRFGKTPLSRGLAGPAEESTPEPAAPPRFGLFSDAKGFRETLRRRIRSLPPEDIEDNPHGALQYALEVLDLPRNVVANLVNTVVGAKPSSKTRAFGLRKVYAADLLRKLGLHAGPDEAPEPADGAPAPPASNRLGLGGRVIDALAGFVGDVALDPLTYLGGAGAVVRGGTRLTQAGAKIAAERTAQLARTTQRLAAESAPQFERRVAQLGRGLTPANAARKVVPLNRLGAAPPATVSQAGENIAARQLRAGVEREAFRQVAAESPELVERAALKLSTKPLREFGPLDLPMALATGTTSLIAPQAGAKLVAGWKRVAPFQKPFARIPELEKTIVTRDQLASLSNRLGLGKLAERAAAAPLLGAALGAASEGAKQLLRGAQRRLSTAPLPPDIPHARRVLSGEAPVPRNLTDAQAAEIERYQIETLEREQQALIHRELRRIGFDTPRQMQRYIDDSVKLSGLPEPAVRDILINTFEMRRSAAHGKESLERVAQRASEIAVRHGGTPEQAGKLVRFVNETAPAQPTRPLPSPPPAPPPQTLADAIEAMPDDVRQARTRLAAIGARLAQPLRLRLAEPVNAEDAVRTVEGEKGLRQWLLGKLSPRRRAELLANPTELAARVNDAAAWSAFQRSQQVSDANMAELGRQGVTTDLTRRMKEIEQRAAGIKSKRGRAEYLAASPEYQSLRARRRALLSTDATQIRRQARQEGEEDARAGLLSENALVYAPLALLPEYVRQPLQRQAEIMYDLVASVGQGANTPRAAVLRQIARGGHPSGLIADQERESLLQQLAGGEGKLSRAQLAGYAPRTHDMWYDPLIELLTTRSAEERDNMIDGALVFSGTESPPPLWQRAVQVAGDENAAAQLLETHRAVPSREPPGDQAVAFDFGANVAPETPSAIPGKSAAPAGNPSASAAPPPLSGQASADLPFAPADRPPAPPYSTAVADIPGGQGPAGRLEMADPVREITDELARRAKQRIDEASAVGAPARELRTQREMDYLSRLLVDDGATNLGRWFRRTPMKLQHRFTRLRSDELREKFTIEANEMLAAIDALHASGGPEAALKAAAGDPEALKLLETLQLRPGERAPRFSTEIPLVAALRDMEHTRSVGAAAFFREAAARYGVRVNTGANLPEGYVHPQIPALGDIAREFAFRPETAQLLARHFGQLEESSRVLTGVRRLMNLWKGTVLMAPAYHIRNLFGNVWNASLVDGFDPATWAEARQIQQSIARGTNLKQRVAGTGLTVEQLWRRLAIDHGLIGSGFYSTEFAHDLERMRETLDLLQNQPSGKRAAQLLRGGKFLRANQAIGSIGEDASRIGIVLTRLRRGDDLDTAVATARKALFDYGDLTAFERGTPNRPGLRDVLPFYTWARKNAELMLAMAFTRPRVLAMLPKLSGNIEAAVAGDETLPPSLRPPHVLEEAGIQLGRGENPQFLNAGYLLPIGEARLVNPLNPGGAARAWLNQVAGPLKLGLDLATNHDSYTDRPIRDYPGQMKEFLGVPVPPEAKHLLRTIRPLNLLEQARTTAEAAAAEGGPAQAAGAVAGQLAGLRTFTADVPRQVFERQRALNDQLGATRRDMKRRLLELSQAGADPAADGEMRRLLEIHEQLRGERDSLPSQEARAATAPLSRRRLELLDQFLQQARAVAPPP